MKIIFPKCYSVLLGSESVSPFYECYAKILWFYDGNCWLFSLPFRRRPNQFGNRFFFLHGLSTNRSKRYHMVACTHAFDSVYWFSPTVHVIAKPVQSISIAKHTHTHTSVRSFAFVLNFRIWVCIWMCWYCVVALGYIVSSTASFFAISVVCSPFRFVLELQREKRENEANSIHTICKSLLNTFFSLRQMYTQRVQNVPIHLQLARVRMPMQSENFEIKTETEVGEKEMLLSDAVQRKKTQSLHNH